MQLMSGRDRILLLAFIAIPRTFWSFIRDIEQKAISDAEAETTAEGSRSEKEKQ